MSLIHHKDKRTRSVPPPINSPLFHLENKIKQRYAPYLCKFSDKNPFIFFKNYTAFLIFQLHGYFYVSPWGKFYTS
ncbi:hypothetical protein DRJ04_05385 [Candidatus Aerophobetes bacterium]|uniref:Uncharacterized protein n=1 Tax=Aerophobetes bacterium TaxID=2030807 RepID=A0A662DBL6_UNCAE|nr:MAG: hypothetical protein DRJ04_05385 [Candidatus Aerophobetes bacterium]